LADFFELKGAKEFKDRLNKFPYKLQESAGRSAARKAMRIVSKAAVAAVKKFDSDKTPEAIWKNVYLQQSRRGSKAIGGVMMRVGILGGARRPKGKDPKADAQPGGDTRHWRYVELGTEKVAARPFLLPSLENNQSAVYQTLADGLDAAIAKIAKV
jgi:HK97 gp10 family phage protein